MDPKWKENLLLLHGHLLRSAHYFMTWIVFILVSLFVSIFAFVRFLLITAHKHRIQHQMCAMCFCVSLLSMLNVLINIWLFCLHVLNRMHTHTHNTLILANNNNKYVFVEEWQCVMNLLQGKFTQNMLKCLAKRHSGGGDEECVNLFCGIFFSYFCQYILVVMICLCIAIFTVTSFIPMVFTLCVLGLYT